MADTLAVSPLRRLEEAGFNAWPALQTILLDGWVLRLADGYTKRANSANPTYPSLDDDLARKVAQVEAIYRERGLPPIFRLTSFAGPPGLDEMLAARGYLHLDPTLVMTRSLADPLPVPRPSDDVRGLPLDEWLDHYLAVRGPILTPRSTHEAMLRLMGSGARFSVVALPGVAAPVACGLAVIDGELAGLFDIVTAADARNRGHGRALVIGMLRDAADQGATTAYLQVTEANEPACHLYRALGFADAYQYWYRVGTP